MTVKKNICITINSLAPGGAEKQSLLLAKALKPYHNTTVVIINPQPIYKKHIAVIEKDDIKHIFLDRNPIKKIRDFTGFLKKKKIDIIFSFLPTDTIWASICGKIANVPYIFGGIRNSHIAYFKYAALRFANNHLLNYTIANNYAAYDSSIKFGFKKNVMVIPNGIEIRPKSQIKGLQMKTITVISIGRLVKQKGYVTALQAIAELKNTLKSNYVLRYRIVGDGPEQENITGAIKKYDLQKEIELITNPSNIYALLESSEIYLSTSTFEGISNSIMEAMNCALPIVATDAGDNSRLVLHGQNGFLSTIDAYKDIARHLGTLIESPDKRKRMGQASYDHLVKNFSYDAFQKKYLNIIKNIEAIPINNGEVCLQDD
ncbi:glycosyltransferase family 4 protein [Maribacter arenosus]|uniref:Glycosyltransferase family 4 protein n=1 Tax=Maribacter arenosus TaxID=1854708 RepID=A0ABR7VG11_9FLAO|nr:glycosyltransferase family 4 protein [Maribacter arenosus]MBD0852595.1 glycosyltransferase family 4 protein [Maribacter arenosus]